jgi:hypothetical protein
MNYFLLIFWSFVYVKIYNYKNSIEIIDFEWYSVFGMQIDTNKKKKKKILQKFKATLVFKCSFCIWQELKSIMCLFIFPIFNSWTCTYILAIGIQVFVLTIVV